MTFKKNNILNIYIDEGGDLGLQKTCSELYIVAFVFYQQSKLIMRKEKYLNEKLKKVGFEGMIHLMPLVSNRNEFTEYSINTKRKIFWYLFYFFYSSNINEKTFIFDKKYINNIKQLEMKLLNNISNFINDNKEYLNSFDKINIFYDNGQKPLSKILDEAFNNYSNIFKISKFNQIKDRTFQIADMLTFIYKIIYKFEHKKQLTKSEKYFFTKQEIKKIRQNLNEKEYKKNHFKMK